MTIGQPQKDCQQVSETHQATAAAGAPSPSPASAKPKPALVDGEMLKKSILEHVRGLNLPKPQRDDQTKPEQAEGPRGDHPEMSAKDRIRASHALQRADFVRRESRAVRSKWDRLLNHIAEGREVIPEKISPELVPVQADKETGDLFRFATMFWSIPVSRGYGRRLRFLVRDRSNGKLIGIIGLTDPVFNLRDRDIWIGWNVEDRRKRLVNVMDAYVLGAVPPYSSLRAGKLVASLVASTDIALAFAERYGASRGIISKQEKHSVLALVTVTSAMGRSSLYNRLKLTDHADDANERALLFEARRVGATQGFGHFQLTDEHFSQLRRLLAENKHTYASGHQFGQGPNWRLRVLRVGLNILGMSQDVIQHGISRDIYAMPLGINVPEFLTGVSPELVSRRFSTERLAAAAVVRWVLPRAASHPSFRDFTRDDVPFRRPEAKQLK